MGRLVFRARPLYRFVRERLTGLSRGECKGVRRECQSLYGSLRSMVGRIEDASLQNSSCCSSSCLLPSLRPLTRDYILDCGARSPMGCSFDCQPRESLQGIQSRFAAYACIVKLGALRGLRALHRLRRVSCVGVTAYRESPSSWPVGLSGGRVEWKCRVVAVVRFAMPLSRRGSGCVRLIAA